MPDGITGNIQTTTNFQQQGIEGNLEFSSENLHVLAQVDGEAKASQTNAVEILNRDFSTREVSRDNLLSREGLRSVFGKTTFFAKVKDQTVHLLHKISDSLAPGSKGSHMMEAKRISDRYQEQVQNNAPKSDLIDTLASLKAEISAHAGNVDAEPAKSFLAFVDAEISLLGSSLNRHEFLKTEVESFDRENLLPRDRIEPETIGDGSKESPIKSSVPEWVRDELSVNKKTDGEVHSRPSREIDSKIDPHLQEVSLDSLSDNLKYNPPLSTAGRVLSQAILDGDGDRVGELLQNLSESISGEIRGQGPEAEFAFATSSNSGFQQEILDLMLKQLPPGDTTLLVDGEWTENAQNFLKNLTDGIAANLSNQKTGENSILLDGKTYEKQKQLGDGGFGIVDLYVAQDGSSLAVKRMKLESGEDKVQKLEEGGQEARMHRAISGDPESKIVQFKGVIRSNDGNLLIAMETAPRGRVDQVGQKIDKALQEGKISQNSANLMKITLWQDMLQGMVHLQEKSGMTHFDVKGPNFFLSEGGVALLSDFGTAGFDLNRNFSLGGEGSWNVDNPMYLAPEILIGKKTLEDSPQIKDVSDRLAQVRRELYLLGREIRAEQTRLNGLLEKGEITKDQMDEIMGSFEDRKTKLNQLEKSTDENLQQLKQEAFFGVNEKADTWSAGVAGLELFTGQPIFERERLFMVSNALIEFGQNPENRIRQGEGSVDRILNRMLDPVPENRPMLSDILQSSLFQEPGVGSEEVRDLINALTDDNPDPRKIEELNRSIGV